MNFIKDILEQLLRYIDNGKFFREPMKIYYILNGILPFAIPLAYIYYLVKNWDDIFRYMEGWTNFTMVIGAILVAVWLFILAYGALVYWLHRKDQLGRTVRTGDSITAIPVLAHYIQCAGESTGLILGIAPIGAYVIMYIVMFLNGFNMLMYEFEFGKFLEYALKGIVILVVIALVLFLICYPIVLLSHVIGEKLRIKAQVANDLRDVSDIHRSATMTEESAEPAEQETAEPESEEATTEE